MAEDIIEQAKRTVGMRLRTNRISAEFTQADVAEELNVSEMTVWRWETGRSEPSFGRLQQLAALYQVPVDQFLRVPPPESMVIEANDGSTHEERRQDNDDVATVPILGVVETEVERTTPTQVVAGEYPVPRVLLEKHPNLKAVVVDGFGLRREGIFDGDVLFLDSSRPLTAGKLYALYSGRERFVVGRFVILGDEVGFDIISYGDEIAARNEGEFQTMTAGGSDVYGEIVMHFGSLGEYYADRKADLEK